MLLSMAICCGESCGGKTPPPNPATPPTPPTPPTLPLGGGICFSMEPGTWRRHNSRKAHMLPQKCVGAAATGNHNDLVNCIDSLSCSHFSFQQMMWSKWVSEIDWIPGKDMLQFIFLRTKQRIVINDALSSEYALQEQHWLINGMVPRFMWQKIKHFQNTFKQKAHRMTWIFGEFMS